MYADTDADEMAEDCNRGEYDSLAEKSSAALSDIDITDSEEEPDEQDQEDDMGDSLQQRDNSRSKLQPATAAHHDQASPSDSKRRSQKQCQHQGQGSHSTSGSSRHQGNRKRPRLVQEQEDQQEGEQEIDCSSEQYAADVRRLRESKLKHNKNEQMR